MEQGVTGEGPTPPPPETEKLEFKMVSSLKLDEKTNPCPRLICDSNNINDVGPTAEEVVPAANLLLDSVEEVAFDKPTARLVNYLSTPGTL